MRITETLNSFKASLENAGVPDKCKRVAGVAYYILQASESPLAPLLEQGKRIGTIGMCTVSIIQRKDVAENFKEIGVNVVFIIVDLFSHPICVIIMGAGEIYELSEKLVTEIKNRDIHLVVTVGNIAAKTFLIYAKIFPSPEAIVIAVVIRIAEDLGQSFNAFSEGKNIEGVGFLAAAAVRGVVNQDHFQFLNRKWTVLTDPKFAKIWARVQEGEDTDFLKNHPMENLREAIDNGSEIHILDDQGNKLNLGANFSNLGGDMVKDMHLTGRVQKLKNGEVMEIRFRLTRVAREKIQLVFDEYKTFNPGEIAEFLQMAGVANGLSVATKSYTVYTNENGVDTEQDLGYALDAHHMTFDGLGNIQAGAYENINGIYKNVSATVGGNATSKKLHMLLSLGGMGEALLPSTPLQIARMKLGMLYAAFRPSKGIPLRRTAEFFTLPLDQLRGRMVENDPDMDRIFSEKLPLMTQKEVRPGWLQWTIPGLANDVAKAGAAYLTHHVAGSTEFPSIDRVVMMMRMGILSTKLRNESGVKRIEGMSSYEDVWTGGNEAVFTRHVALGDLDDIDNRVDEINKAVQSSQYGVTLFISLKSLERTSYQYHSDLYGAKGKLDAYIKHENVVDFSRNETAKPRMSNEVMLNQMVTTEEIRAIMVGDATKKKQLINKMEKAGLIEKRDGVSYYQDRPIDSLVFTYDQGVEAVKAAKV